MNQVLVTESFVNKMFKVIVKKGARTVDDECNEPEADHEASSTVFACYYHYKPILSVYDSQMNAHQNLLVPPKDY